MWNFTRKRQTAGNICLVLFTAFLFTILVSPFAMVGSAEAATSGSAQVGDTTYKVQSVTGSPGSYAIGGDNQILNTTTSTYQILIKLAASPLSTFEGLRIDFVKVVGGTLLGTVYGSDSSKFTSNGTFVYESVYENVYQLAFIYSPNFTIDAPTGVYAKVYVGDAHLFDLLMTLNPPPPQDDPTPPPPPATEEEEEEEEEVEVEEPKVPTVDEPVVEVVKPEGTNTLTRDADTGAITADFAVNDDDLLGQINTTPEVPKEVAIVATTTAGTTQTTVGFGAANLQKAADTNTTLIVKTDLTQVKIAPKAVDSKSAATAMAAATDSTEKTVAAINQAKSGIASTTTQTAVQKAVSSVVGQLTAKVTTTEAVASAAQVAEAVKEVADKVAKGEGKVEMTTSTVTASKAQVAEALGNSDNANIQAIGVVLDLKLAVKVKLDNPVNGVDEVSMPITEFAEPILLSLDPPADWTQGKDVVLVKVEGGKVIKTVTGTYNSATGKLDFVMTDWSYWTMAIKVWAFADIIGHWAVNDIGVMADAGIVKGIADNKFAPDANITRAEFATMLVKALGLFEVTPFVATFKDVKSSDWYYSMVETAARNGLAAGAHGNFNPNAKITRQEMAAMIANAMKKQGKSTAISAADAANLLAKFTDSKQIASWAQNSVALNVQKGIIVGRTQNSFAPTANATRAEGTVMIKKLLGK